MGGKRRTNRSHSLQLSLPLWYNTNDNIPLGQGDTSEMNAREQRGAELAARGRIKQEGTTWSVPSQSNNGRYTVDLNGPEPTCTCADYELRADVCKHIFAVARLLREGQTGQKEPVPARTPRPTYSQNWPAYNAAQVNEKRQFLALLSGLCAGVP